MTHYENHDMPDMTVLFPAMAFVCAVRPISAVALKFTRSRRRTSHFTCVCVWLLAQACLAVVVAVARTALAYACPRPGRMSRLSHAAIEPASESSMRRSGSSLEFSSLAYISPQPARRAHRRTASDTNLRDLPLCIGPPAGISLMGHC